MRVEDILWTMKQRDIRILKYDGNKLTVTAPKGALTEEVMREMKRHKEAIIKSYVEELNGLTRTEYTC